ncbi:MAG TPA: sensor histidine kinase [Candidatus Binataceae bacterium]|nr:sensor histidine kinase [Candidatus Binataceae bacterium]
MRKATSKGATAIGPGREGTSEDRLRVEAAHIAQTALEGCAGVGCLVGWQHPTDSGEVRLPAEGPRDTLIDRLLAISHRMNLPANAEALTGSGALSISILGPDDLLPLIHAYRNDDRPNDSAIAIGRTADARAHVLLTAPARGSGSTVTWLASLALRAMLNRLEADIEHDLGDFWRDRATANGAKLAAMVRTSKTSAAHAQALESGIATLPRLRTADRFNGLGSVIAGEGPFAAWIVGVSDQEQWKVAAASGVLVPSAPFKKESAMAACCVQRMTIVRTRENEGAVVYAEDRLFARFAAYLCAPFDGGAIALASRELIDQSTIGRVESLVARVNPMIRSWLLEAETQRLRTLVQNLGLRMFAAADTERARIARDLHDHQAQLMAAARVAIEAGPDEARSVFKQVEEALRLRVRELRPATLGRTPLAEALKYELRRLAEAGIKGRLLHPDQMNKLTRTLQQLCYQVAREALANVIRHAGASRVTIDVVKRGSQVRLSIRDNGRGIPATSGTGGIGLKGLRERIELMGGKLRVESEPGSTRLIAELSEPA